MVLTLITLFFGFFKAKLVKVGLCFNFGFKLLKTFEGNTTKVNLTKMFMTLSNILQCIQGKFKSLIPAFRVSLLFDCILIRLQAISTV